VAAPADVEVWLVDLDAGGDEGWTVLSDDERARADRFVFETHRRRFVAGRAHVRRLLGGRLGLEPAQVALVYGPVGKPALADVRAPRFNLSHSDRYALVALAAGEVGVDLECIRPLPNLDDVAARVFTAGERQALDAWPAAERAQAFFSGWTRKEAYIKAVGQGIARLAHVEVAMAPGAPPALLRVDDEPEAPKRWALHDLAPLPGFVAAVCFERPSPEPSL
jgi:4'-phosphopantetheinyl transferase